MYNTCKFRGCRLDNSKTEAMGVTFPTAIDSGKELNQIEEIVGCYFMNPQKSNFNFSNHTWDASFLSIHSQFVEVQRNQLVYLITNLRIKFLIKVTEKAISFVCMGHTRLTMGKD